MTLEEIRGLLEKATPGPWEFDPNNTGRCFDDGYGLIGPHVHVSAYCGMGHREILSAEDDARLIAAAPELAALLVRAVEALEVTTGLLNGLCGVICDEDIAIVDPVVAYARSLLRELGVEA